MLSRSVYAVLSVLLLLSTPTLLFAQSETIAETTRSQTGGAQTLEDILARQKGDKLDNSFRSEATGDPAQATGLANQLGPLGGVSDPEVFRALRYGSADVTASAQGPTTNLLIQDSGMAWLKFRSGPLTTYGSYLLLGMLVVLVAFYLLRGKIKIDGPKNGVKILRFKAVERFGHWLLAGSFIILGLTGLATLLGRKFLIPVIGKDGYANIALVGKWVHNNVAWAFIAGLIMVVVMWIAHNIPNKGDLNWLAKGGGLFSKGVHPPAKKFNAGQKLIFWAVVLLGVSISVSGVSLLFPFQFPIFEKTFVLMNMTGIPGLLTGAPLPEMLTPYQEMQLAHAWHGIVAFLFLAIIIAHIYLGSVGMEGAFDAMGSGEVEEQWAKEHHSLWYDDVKSSATEASQKPGE